jgi:hypothetical protein
MYMTLVGYGLISNQSSHLFNGTRRYHDGYKWTNFVSYIPITFTHHVSSPPSQDFCPSRFPIKVFCLFSLASYMRNLISRVTTAQPTVNEWKAQIFKHFIITVDGKCHLTRPRHRSEDYTKADTKDIWRGIRALDLLGRSYRQVTDGLLWTR